VVCCKENESRYERVKLILNEYKNKRLGIYFFNYNFILDFEIHELNSLGDAIHHSPDKLIL
jgi:hypothetical protein